MKFLFFVACSVLFSSSVFAADSVSFQYKSDAGLNPQFEEILNRVNLDFQLNLTGDRFLLIEDKQLATSHFLHYFQVDEEQIPLKGASIRVWRTLSDNSVILCEGEVSQEELAPRSILGKLSVRFKRSFLYQTTVNEAMRAVVKSFTDDSSVRDFKSHDYNVNGELVREFKVRGKKGTHFISVSVETLKVLSHTYTPFSKADVLANVYPIYEEVEGSKGDLLPRKQVLLTNLKTMRAETTDDPFQDLKKKQYLADNFDPLLGLIPVFQLKGYWAMSDLKEKAKLLRMQAGTRENSFQNGMALIGEHATVSFHPDAPLAFGPLSFKPEASFQFIPVWKNEPEEMIPSTGFFGKPLTSQEEVLNRVARRHPHHDSKQYIEDGFDEIQVYYAIEQLFSSLAKGGFTDPELATRPFNAFLYDPSIESRDNAYYTDDTINFTTYSSDAQNYARDNSTIWHELGHGVMDRLMGDFLNLADTGGLSEGMADFVAALVIEDVMKGENFPGSQSFRIQNGTGFFLTNEVHDDGEAYGGAMYDFLQASLAQFGRTDGLRKVMSLTMEGMRLSRNHPHLTAIDWFNHLLYADSLGEAGIRSKGELSPILAQALANRNFSFDSNEKIANFQVKYDGEVLTSKEEGSRLNPIKLTLKDGESKKFNLSFQVSNSEKYKFRFPVGVKVSYAGGPLQGSAHFKGEEMLEQSFLLHSEDEIISHGIEVESKCDAINREDGSCVDYVYVSIWNEGAPTKPQAKKRFYVRVMKVAADEAPAPKK